MTKKLSHLKTAAKTVSWRVFAGLDTFAVAVAATAWVGGNDWATACSAAFGVVGLEIVTKVVWFYGHERLWEGWLNKFFETEEAK